MMHRFWRPASLAALLIVPRSTCAFASCSKPLAWGRLPTIAVAAANQITNGFATTSSLSAATQSGNMESTKIELAPPVNGVPGQDLIEEQPIRNPIGKTSTVLVVGGTRGIGLEFAQQCAAKGAKVIASHRGEDMPESLQLLAAENPRVEGLSMDVSDEGSIAKAAQTLKARDNFSPLTHLIHSAGEYPKGMSLDGTPRGGRPSQPVVTKDDMMTSYLINAVGPLMVAQAFVPLLGTAANGPAKNLPVLSLLTSKVGSVYDNGSGGTYAYRSSKSALNNIAKSLSVDLAGEASVVLLHPGYVRTDMTGGKGLIDTRESVEGMLKAIETTDASTGFRFVDFKACIIPW